MDKTTVLNLIKHRGLVLEFRYDHHDQTIYAMTVGDMLMPSRAAAEEIIKGWLSYYDLVPDVFVDGWDTAMRRRFDENDIVDTGAPGSVSGYVYLAHSETGHYKIGISHNPDGRIRVFDTQMPVKVELIHTFKADNARQAENRLHSNYKSKHHVGEWFNLDPGEVEYIKSIKRYENGRFERI